MRFLFDRNVSEHLARGLSHFCREHDVTHQDDDGRFERDDTDVEILAKLQEDAEGLVWVTADLRQKRVKAERAAILQSGVSVVFLKNFLRLRTDDQALKLVAVWPELCRQCLSRKGPMIFEIPCGSVTSKKVVRLGRPATVLRDLKA